MPAFQMVAPALPACDGIDTNNVSLNAEICFTLHVSRSWEIGDISEITKRRPFSHLDALERAVSGRFNFLQNIPPES